MTTNKDLALVPVANTAVKMEEMDNEYVLFNENNTKVTYLNETAALIWSMCDGESSGTEIIRQLEEDFPEAGDQIEKDVKSTFSELDQNGLLKWVEKGNANA